MTTSQIPEPLRAIAGLTWLGTERHPLEAKSAWRAIVPNGACTFGRVTESDDPLNTRRNAAPTWAAAFLKSGLLANSSEVLLSLGGHAGGGTWQRVRVSDPLTLLSLGFPEPEFIVMNIEKTRFVAVTTEEHELLVFCGARLGDDWILSST